MSNNNVNINEDNGNNAGFVYSMIKKYSKKRGYTPVKNISINIETKERIYKLIRLNNEQFYLLYKNSISIFEDYSHLMYLSMNKDIIYSSFSKMYITLKGNRLAPIPSLPPLPLERIRVRARNQRLNPPPPPVSPLAGEGGLNGYP